MRGRRRLAAARLVAERRELADELAEEAFHAEIDAHEAHCADCSLAARTFLAAQVALASGRSRPRLSGSLGLALGLA